MPSGRFGKASLAANSDTDLFTCPTGEVATATVSMCNRTPLPVDVRIAVRNAALSDSDYIEYGTTIPPNGVLERSQIVLSAGEIITVRANAAGVSARVHGFTEVA